jgi:hypothetical protein
MPRQIALLFLLVFAVGKAFAEDEQALKNWFNDPFFQVRDAISACPVPLGPLMTASQRNADAHYRVERGTSCWLKGKCDKVNAYLYDASIAEAIRQHFSQSPAFHDTSLWVTVQRKFVTVQGCLHAADQATQIETLIKIVPDVERVILELASSPQEKPPYLTAPTQATVIDRSK